MPNIPTFDTNKFVPTLGTCSFDGVVKTSTDFVVKEQLLDSTLWARFVNQFRLNPDIDDLGWRGEYFGKMMRGACFIYSTTKNEELYDVITVAIKDILTTMDKYNRISTYSLEKEFMGWDMWSRKYVLLALQYYLEICKDEAFKKDIIKSMCLQADYILEHIGPRDTGKKEITDASRHWRGLNSCSILEPMVRLYNITKEQRYLDFAKYIVDLGGTAIFNIFKAALEDEFAPYQYPITKAYEMTSCFEGLIEYYRVVKEPWMLKAIVNFANKVIDTDFTIIGCSGCTHELFDHSSVRQSNQDNIQKMQETCVTVTIMKYFYQVTLLTGDSKYVDAFETSFYNAYLGSLNINHSEDLQVRSVYPNSIYSFLPFDSYSPLTKGHRGNGVGGLLVMPDNYYYGCCACIGSLGSGLYGKMNVMKAKDGIVINLYNKGTIEFDDYKVNIEGNYPYEDNVKIKLSKSCKLYLRNPSWSKTTIVNGKSYNDKGYIAVDYIANEEISIIFSSEFVVAKTERYGKQILINNVIWHENYIAPTMDYEHPKAKDSIAIVKGPIVLALDESLGYTIDDVMPVDVDSLNKSTQVEGVGNISYNIPLTNGKTVKMVDYASSGKDWNNGKSIAAWFVAK